MAALRGKRSATEPEFQAGRPGREMPTLIAIYFTGAVQAGADLCAGIGTAGFEYASDLIGGEW